MERHLKLLRISALQICALTQCAFLPAQSTPPTPAQSAVPMALRPAAKGERRPHLSGERVTLALAIVKGYPFLEGEINGVKGKLLFDVGEESAFAINGYRVTPPHGVTYGHGFWGSGQSFLVTHFPVIDDLKLPGGLEYKGSTNIRGNTGQQLEDHITPDFIGWIGLDFFEGYVMKLDLQRSDVTFYRSDANDTGSKAAIDGEQVLQVIQFDNKGHRNLPTLPVHVGSSAFIATLDTGSHTALWRNCERSAATTEIAPRLGSRPFNHRSPDEGCCLADLHLLTLLLADEADILLLAPVSVSALAIYQQLTRCEN
jgi:hypothetical protein